jgi:hypothetical protein
VHCHGDRSMVVTDGVVCIPCKFLLTHDTLVDKGDDAFPRFFFGVTSLYCFRSYPKSWRSDFL